MPGDSRNDLCHWEIANLLYDDIVKYVFLAIFVLFAAQPVQAKSCDMHDSQTMSHSDSHDMDHEDGQDMDCCDHDPSVPSDNCDSTSHCGACTAGVLAFNTFVVSTIHKTNSKLYLPDTGEPLNPFNPPPFKPPIV